MIEPELKQHLQHLEAILLEFVPRKSLEQLRRQALTGTTYARKKLQGKPEKYYEFIMYDLYSEGMRRTLERAYSMLIKTRTTLKYPLIERDSNTSTFTEEELKEVPQGKWMTSASRTQFYGAALLSRSELEKQVLMYTTSSSK